jgi:hypothetical protein
MLKPPSRLDAVQSGWIFMGYVQARTEIKNARPWEIKRKRSLRNSLPPIEATLRRVFVSPSFGLDNVTQEYLRGNGSNEVLRKAFFGLPDYVLFWFRVGQCSIVACQMATSASEQEYRTGKHGAKSNALAAGIAEAQWISIEKRIDAVRFAVTQGSGLVGVYAVGEVYQAIQSLATAADIEEHNQSGRKTVNVTVNFGSGNTFTGPVAVGETITQTYSQAATTSDPELRRKLEELVAEVSQLIENLADDGTKEAVSHDLEAFVKNAKSTSPSSQLLNIKGAGLIEAAKTVAEMAGPIASTIRTILGLFA